MKPVLRLLHVHLVMVLNTEYHKDLSVLVILDIMKMLPKYVLVVKLSVKRV